MSLANHVKANFQVNNSSGSGIAMSLKGGSAYRTMKAPFNKKVWIPIEEPRIVHVSGVWFRSTMKDKVATSLGQSEGYKCVINRLRVTTSSLF